MSDTLSIAGKRHYIIPGKKNVFLPSVTTIIGSMTDKSGLDEWAKRIGQANADKISKFSANRGTLMHSFIEHYLTSEKLEKKDKLLEALKTVTERARIDGFTEEEIKIGRKLFYNFYLNSTFDKMKRIVMQEKMLYSFNGGGYAGRVDNIHEDYSQHEVITDFKTSRKPKKEEWIYGYKLQISAYFVAYWELTGSKPNRGEIWISNEESDEPQIFTLSYEDIKKYYKEFIDMVKAYHIKYGSEVKDYVSSIQ